MLILIKGDFLVGWGMLVVIDFRVLRKFCWFLVRVDMKEVLE